MSGIIPKNHLTEPILSIFIVNFNSTDFIGCSLSILKDLTKNKYKVLIVDNGSKISEYKSLLKVAKLYPNVSVHRNETTLTGSMAHGTALNQLVRDIDTPYFCILDADATWLAKDWDAILIQRLNEKVKVIGTQTSPETYKPSDFPLIFSILFETATFKKLHIDFRPSATDPTKDTGYEMREKYLNAGYLGEVLEIKNTRLYKSGPFSDIICAEYYLKDHNNIFACHFGRGSNPLGKKNIKTKSILLNASLIPINYALWKKDKNKWIDRCISIAKGQLHERSFKNHVNVLTVHYDTQQFIENLVFLLGQEKELFFRFIVVDNSKNLDSTRLHSYKNVEVVIVQGQKAETNVLESHRSALNIGLANIDFRLPFTLFLDPDVIFSQQGISLCKTYMEKNAIDVAGVHKFYQYKSGREIALPYIWFTLIKTQHLDGFTFKPVHSNFFNLFYKESRRDTGDSIYSLIRSKNLKYHTIPKLPKTEQLKSHPLKDIQTDDWLDRDMDISVSHYRGGSIERTKVIHPGSSQDEIHRFIGISKTFFYDENLSLRKLNLGGGKKAVKNTTNVDIFNNSSRSIVHDLNIFPYPFPDNSVSYCILDNVLEHLDNPILVLKELHRITAHEGTVEIFVPYFKHGGAYQDPTHKHFFHENYFDYFSDEHTLNYEVENINFKITKKELLIRKTGVLMNPILLVRKALPFKGILRYFLWDIYDTLHVKIEPKK